MLAATAEFLDAIRGPHTLAVDASITPPGGTAEPLLISGGQVTIDRTATHRRRLELTLSDPGVYPANPVDPVNVYGSEAIVRRGVRYGNDQQELIQLGVFRVEDLQRTHPGGEIPLTGWDRSRQVADERFVAPRRFNAQPAVDLIQLLVSEVYPTVTFDIQTDDATTIKKHHVDRDRWEEIQRVAKVIGCEAFFTSTGAFRIQPTPDPATAVAVWTVDAGPGGVLVGVRDSVTREGAPNGVVAIGEDTSGDDPPVQDLRFDDDPASPTHWGGPYGKVPRFYASPLITTKAQAGRAAQSLLNDHLGVSRTVSFDAVPNPALTAGDAIRIVYPDGSSELHMIDTLTIPLGPDGTLTGETRAVDWGGE